MSVFFKLCAKVKVLIKLNSEIIISWKYFFLFLLLDIFHEEMAKYFRKTISQICHLKYEEAKFVANQMVDVVEIAFPDVIRNLQEPYEMGKS